MEDDKENKLEQDWFQEPLSVLVLIQAKEKKKKKKFLSNAKNNKVEERKIVKS